MANRGKQAPDDAGKGRSGDPAARAAPSLTDSHAVISYTQAPMKRESGRNEGSAMAACLHSSATQGTIQGRLSQPPVRSTTTSDAAHRGATLLTLTLNRFAAHRAPVLHRPPPTFGV